MKKTGCMLIAISLLAFSATAFSVEVKNMKCTATHHSLDAAGNDNAEMVGKNIKVIDIGTSFTVVIGKEKIHSPSLVKIDNDGQTALVGKSGDTYYTKMPGNYVIQNKGRGYVISDCK